MAVYTWGLGKSGQLGNGTFQNSELPTEVKMIRPTTVSKAEGRRQLSSAIHISAGGLFTACATREGNVLAFGCGKNGRLGNNKEDDQSNPVLLPALKNITKVSCGSWHGAALDSDGCLYIWGYGASHGVLGQTISTAFSPPLAVSDLCQVVGVSCGNNFTLAWMQDGRVYSWGCGRHGVLGHGDTKDRHMPTQIEGNYGTGGVVHASAGFAHCGLVTANNRVVMFGKGKDGALGLGSKHNSDTSTPQEVSLLNSAGTKQVSCSVGEHHGHTLAVTEDGTVYAWGDGYKGKLGLGTQESQFSPVQIPSAHFQGEKIIQVSAGGIHSAAVSEQGHLFTWGCGSDGRLGHPEAKGHRYLFRSDIPKSVDFLDNVGKVTQVSASYYHTVALVETILL